MKDPGGLAALARDRRTGAAVARRNRARLTSPSGPDVDQPRDGEREPAMLAGDRLAVHLRECAARGSRMIEDASHLNDLPQRKRARVFTGRVQVQPEPIVNVGRRPGDLGFDEHLTTAGSQGEPARRKPAAIDVTVAPDQTSGDVDRSPREARQPDGRWESR